MSDYRNPSYRWGGTAARAGADVDQGLRSYMLGVYNNMVLGLALTGLVALGVHMLAVAPAGTTPYRVASNLYLTQFGATLYTSPLRFVVMLAPLAFIFFFSFRIDRMAAATARNMFLAFSAVMGLSLSSILLVYTGQSVALAFFETAAAFGALSLYGYTTRRDLTAMGSFLTMGLFGLIIVGLVGLFVPGLQTVFSLIAIVIFSGLTAWDTQRIKEMYWEHDGYEVATKKAVNGALMLYLDFINIFMALVQLTGQRNN